MTDTLQVDNFQLLHHFITETCYTLSDRRVSHELWRVTVPQIAFQHEFLLRAIFAIAALHLAQLQPLRQEHYTHLAAMHQDAALRAFRPTMLEINSSNCDASFAMSSLIVVYAFASSKASHELGMFDTAGPSSNNDWLPLIRGVDSILRNLWASIKRGRLNALLHDHTPFSEETQLPAVLNDQLRRLETAIKDADCDADDGIACQQALEQLRYSFIRLSDKTILECEVSLSFLWPVIVPNRFIDMLNERRSEALIILAFYCIILHHLDAYWWMHGCAQHIMAEIESKISSAWQPWLEWPRSIVVPESSRENTASLGTRDGFALLSQAALSGE